MQDTKPLDPLTRLAIQHGTDKFGQHLYTPIYHRMFAHLRDMPIRLLEIGVGWPRVSVLGGASLRMWRDYFPHATLVGIDLQPKRMDLGPRVSILQGSQSDPAFLRALWASHGPFDIVIDDGSHRNEDVASSFETLYPMLPEGGYYAVEDIQTAFWPDFGGNAAAGGTILTRLHEIILAMHAPEAAAAGQVPVFARYGHITAGVQAYRNLVVFERGLNDYPSNRAFKAGVPAVQRVLGMLDAERQRDPSAGEALTRAGMLEVAGELDAALECALDGLSRFPGSLGLLCVVQHLTWQLGRHDDSRAAARKLLELVPDEPLFQAIDQTLCQPA